MPDTVQTWHDGRLSTWVSLWYARRAGHKGSVEDVQWGPSQGTVNYCVLPFLSFLS